MYKLNTYYKSSPVILPSNGSHKLVAVIIVYLRLRFTARNLLVVSIFCELTSLPIVHSSAPHLDIISSCISIGSSLNGVLCSYARLWFRYFECLSWTSSKPFFFRREISRASDPFVFFFADP